VTDHLLREIAAMRAEIAELRRQRVTYREATVTAVDTTAGTYTADVAGAGTLVGIPEQAGFLPVVGDRVLLPIEGATPVSSRPARVSADVVTSGRISAETDITIGDPAADHASIDANRLAFLATAPDGTTVEVVRFGRTLGTTDAATGQQTSSVTEQGHYAVQDLSVTNDPILIGTPFTQHIAPFARFHAASSRGSVTDPALTSPGGGEVGFYEMTVELYPGRIYLLQSSNIWVRPGETGTNRIDLNVRYTVSTDPAVDPAAVSPTNPLFTRSPAAEYGGTSNLGHNAIVSKILRPKTYAHFRFLLSLYSTGGSAYIEMGSENHTVAELDDVIEPEVAQLFVVDLGVHPWTNRAVANTGSSAPAAKKKYTYEYTARWTRRFRGDGTVHTDNGDAYQGYTPFYPANGDQASQIGDFRRVSSGQLLKDDLNGATMEKLEVYLYAEHWHYAAGGTAVIRYHNNTGPGSLNNYAGDKRIAGWARGEARWVDITEWAGHFAGTGAKGIQVGPSGGTDPEFYGVFHGHTGSRPPRLRATFTK
jgi:hypothetical protein